MVNFYFSKDIVVRKSWRPEMHGEDAPLRSVVRKRHHKRRFGATIWTTRLIEADDKTGELAYYRSRDQHSWGEAQRRIKYKGVAGCCKVGATMLRIRFAEREQLWPWLLDATTGAERDRWVDGLSKRIAEAAEAAAPRDVDGGRDGGAAAGGRGAGPGMVGWDGGPHADRARDAARGAPPPAAAAAAAAVPMARAPESQLAAGEGMRPPARWWGGLGGEAAGSRPCDAADAPRRSGAAPGGREWRAAPGAYDGLEETTVGTMRAACSSSSSEDEGAALAVRRAAAAAPRRVRSPEERRPGLVAWS